MDYLMFCTGECTDNLRDRDLFLIKNVDSRFQANMKLSGYLEDAGTGQDVQDFDVLLYGQDMEFSDIEDLWCLVGSTIVLD